MTDTSGVTWRVPRGGHHVAHVGTCHVTRAVQPLAGTCVESACCRNKCKNDLQFQLCQTLTFVAPAQAMSSPNDWGCREGGIQRPQPDDVATPPPSESKQSPTAAAALQIRPSPSGAYLKPVGGATDWAPVARGASDSRATVSPNDAEATAYLQRQNSTAAHNGCPVGS